jgi:transposase
MKPDAHQGYISWGQYLRNRERIRDSAPDFKKGSPGAAKGGTALLSGIILCGKCGRRMRTGYHKGHGNYNCQGVGNCGGRICQSVQSWYVDAAVADSLLGAISPAQLRMSLRAVERVEDQRQQVNKQWDLRLEGARYEAERAHRHLIKAEPEYELVTRNLRRDLEDKLRAVRDLEREREQAVNSSPSVLGPAERRAVVKIANDLPLLWRADTTTVVERKQFLRFLVKDVVVAREGQTASIAVRWQTGACSRLEVSIPDRGAKMRSDPALITLIRRLAADHTNSMIADHLNDARWQPKKGKRFTPTIVQQLRFKNQIPNNCPALSPKVSYKPRGDGRVGTKAAARLLNLGTTTINRWCREGLLDCTRDAPGSPTWIKLDAEQIRELRRPLRRWHPALTPHVDPGSAQAVRDALVSDAVWDAVSPLMPPEPIEINGGRPRVSNRALLCAVIFILRHEITWWVLPTTLGCGCGINCRRRFLLWLGSGVWQPIQEALVKLLPDGARLAWRRTFS